MWTALSALAAIVTAVVAIVSIRQQTQIAKGNSRPYVVPRIEFIQKSHHLEFVIENFGSSAAFDLDVRFGEEVSHREPSANDLGSYLTSTLSNRIPVFAPGQEWRTIVRLHIDEEDEVRIPDEFEVFVSYVGPDRRVRYGEDLDALPFKLSTKHFEKMLYRSQSDHDIEQRIKKLTKVVSDQGKKDSQLMLRLLNLLEEAIDPKAAAERKEQGWERPQSVRDLRRRLSPPTPGQGGDAD